MEKPFWLSKTLWVNVLTIAVGGITKMTGAGEFSGDDALITIAFVNVILRFATKGAVTISQTATQ